MDVVVVAKNATIVNFAFLNSGIDVVGVGKVVHNCSEVLRWRRSRDLLLLLFPQDQPLMQPPENFAEKLFLF